MPTTTVSSSNLWFNRSFIILQSLKQFSVTTSVNVFNATSVAAEKINELFISFLSAYLFNLPLNQPSFFCFFFFLVIQRPEMLKLDGITFFWKLLVCPILHKMALKWPKTKFLSQSLVFA